MVEQESNRGAMTMTMHSLQQPPRMPIMTVPGRSWISILWFLALATLLLLLLLAPAHGFRHGLAFHHARHIDHGRNRCQHRDRHRHQYSSELFVSKRNKQRQRHRGRIPQAPLDVPQQQQTIETPPSASKKKWTSRDASATQSISWCDVSKSRKLQFELYVLDDSTIPPQRHSIRLQKNRMEQIQHVLTMGVLWSIFRRPHMAIEHDIGDSDYLPDVVTLDGAFWGESGRVSVHKTLDLLQRYPDTHIVHCRWGMEIEQIRRPVLEALAIEMERYANVTTTTQHEGAADDDGTSSSASNGSDGTTPPKDWKSILENRTQPFVYASIPGNDVWRFVDADGRINVCRDDLEWEELELSQILEIDVGV